MSSPLKDSSAQESQSSVECSLNRSSVCLYIFSLPCEAVCLLAFIFLNSCPHRPEYNMLRFSALRTLYVLFIPAISLRRVSGSSGTPSSTKISMNIPWLNFLYDSEGLIADVSEFLSWACPLK